MQRANGFFFYELDIYDVFLVMHMLGTLEFQLVLSMGDLVSCLGLLEK